MRRTSLLGYALTLAATLFVGSAMGQASTTTADAKFATGKFVKYETEADEYVTVGTTTGYYATPDPAYHAGWNGTDSWVLTTGTVWNWTGTAATKIYPVTGRPANYVEFTWNTVGDQTLTVSETLPAAFGTSGCLTSTPVSKAVKVIAAPTVAITTTYPAGQTAFFYCTSQLAVDRTPSIALNIVEAAPASAAVNYIVGFSIKKDEIASTGVVTAGTATDQPKQVVATATGNINLPELTLTAGSARTKYTVKLNYLSSVISRKGDFNTNSDYATTDAAALLAKNWTNFFATDAARVDEMVYYVNAAPVTGPVYHISNNFAK